MTDNHVSLAGKLIEFLKRVGVVKTGFKKETYKVDKNHPYQQDIDIEADE